MPLQRLPLLLEAAAAPRNVWSLLAEADERIETFMDVHRGEPVPGFYPSDFRMVYHALLYLDRQDGLANRRVCEWGSGFGVVSCLAAYFGATVYGIEADRRLVDEALALVRDRDVSVQFFHGSFVPSSARDSWQFADDLIWLDLSARSAYPRVGLDPVDFDLVYAYPWPGEERVILDLFDDHAMEGAMLLTYHGSEDLRLHRKLPDKRRKGRR
jgi:hypothetical protein